MVLTQETLDGIWVFFFFFLVLFCFVLFFFFTLFNHLYLELVGERKHKKDNQANI